MENSYFQIIELIRVMIFAITAIYITRLLHSRKTKKFSIKFKENLIITTEYFDD